MTNYKEELQSLQRKMVLTGKGQVMVTPDLANIRIGVQTNADSVTAAQSENARISQNVINSLKQLGLTEMQTVQYQIEKVYEYQNGQRIDLGYQVRNVLDVFIDNMALVGTAVDTAVENGANIVDSINFDVSSPDIYYQQALNLAVKNAIQKAKGIATGLKSMFDPVPILITENSTAPIPIARNIAFREGAFATPIEPGNNKIEASVTVEFIY
ncbi:MAG TPA: SIMPL domain-containing protein [Mobilitalea sp.]|nr:SIMPL domain-containing protein [Mobilitalea sp.]